MPDVEFVVFEPSDCRMDGWFRGLPNVQTRSTTIPSVGRWRKLVQSSRFWADALRKEKFDLFEAFHLPLPPVQGGKVILTLHDVRRLHADWGWLERTSFRHALTRAIRKTDAVVTVSEAMKQELLPYCAQTPIWVVPNGLVDKDQKPTVGELESFRKKFALATPYLLAVGHFEPRKNYPRLIEAFATFREKGYAYNLLIVGNDSGERVKLEAQIVARGLKGVVTLASGLSDVEVRCAYLLCDLFVFPSTYEGFGIPILEAMAAGRSLAISDLSVFREIAGGCATYFSPLEVNDIARGIELALSFTDGRDARLNDGLERSSRYDYSAIAACYEKLYQILSQ